MSIVNEIITKYGKPLSIAATVLGFGLSILSGQIDKEEQKTEIQNSVKAEVAEQLKDLKS